MGKKIRILEVVSDLDGGGVDRLMYDYCSRMIPDIQFDFVTMSMRTEEGILEAPLKAMGCQVYHVDPVGKNVVSHLKQLNRIIREGNYDIIHTHGNYRNVDCLLLAWLHGVKKRIAHSHIAYIPESRLETLARKTLVPITKLLSTKLYACGEDAAVWMWGERAYQKGHVRIMMNAIDTAKFVFSEEKRQQLRAELSLQGKYVIGTVARLSYQKNHKFLIEIFQEFRKRNPAAVLLLVGQGELEQQIRAQVCRLGLEGCVIFLGVRDDVSDLLNVMDVFLLPSRFEGLGIVYVEAQANGLYGYASEGVVPKAANAGNMLTYLPLSASAVFWAEALMNVKERLHADNSERIRQSGYDIETAALEQKKIYMTM